MKVLLGFVVLVACVATAGCGSSAAKKMDGGGGTGGGGGIGGTNGDAGVNTGCPSFTACGGDIVGTWHYTSGCGSFSSSTCASEHFMTMVAAGSQATYTFGSGGAFTDTFSGTVNEMLSFALSCLAGVTDAGIPQACADLQKLYRDAMAQPDAGSAILQIASATCSAGGNQTCDCTLVFNYLSQQTQSGSYTVSGNQVTVTITNPAPDGGVADSTPVEYCVSGNTLTLRSFDSSGNTFTTTFTR